MKPQAGRNSKNTKPKFKECTAYYSYNNTLYIHFIEHFANAVVILNKYFSNSFQGEKSRFQGEESAAVPHG